MPDAPARNYEKQLDADNLVFLKRLRQLIEQQGYRRVQIIPQLFVARVTDAHGQEHTLIVNSDTLQGYAFDGRLPLSDKPSESQLPELH